MTKTQLFEIVLAIQHETDASTLNTIIKEATEKLAKVDPTERLPSITKYKGLDTHDCFIVDAFIYALNLRGVIIVVQPTDFEEIKQILISFKRICFKIKEGTTLNIKDVYKFLISLSTEDSFKYAETHGVGVSNKLVWHVRKLAHIISLVNTHYPNYFDSHLLHVVIQGEI